MTQDLFRQEVLDVQSEKWLGSVRIATPISIQVWTLAAVGVVASVLIWLFAGHYTQREHVMGTLVPRAGLLTVTARSSGVVTQLTVTEGAAVHAGDPLIVLSGERSSAELGDTAANISAQLRKQRAHIEADLATTQRLADEQAADLRMQQRMLQGQIRQLDGQMAIEQHEVEAQTGLLDKLKSLRSNGYVSVFNVRQQESAKNEAEMQLKSLGKDRLQAQQQLMSAVDALAQLPMETNTKISALKSQMAQVEESLQSNEADRATVLHAPKDGVVSSILIKSGQTVTQGQSLAAIVPVDSPLQAQLLVPSSAIGFVRIGSDVALHYEAFPYQKFGIQHGKVASISKSALTPEEVSQLIGDRAPEEPVYRVEVGLARQNIEAYGKLEPLMPGMALQASLFLDKRRIIEWVFEPLYGMKRRYQEGQG
jgi:membrane fusion protein